MKRHYTRLSAVACALLICAIIIPRKAVGRSGPEHPEVIVERAMTMMASPAADCDEAAGYLDTFQLAIEIVRWDFKDQFSATEADKRHKIDTLEAAIDRTIATALAIDSACVKAHLYRAWPAVQGMAYNDTLRAQALQYYRDALHYAPDDAELKARLAYCLEISDSLDLALELYQDVVNKGVKRFDIPKAIERIQLQRQVRERFFAAPGESYILLERRPTYAGMDPPVPFCRIWGNGRCEYYDYYAGSEEPLACERQIDSAQVDSIIADLQRLSFLSLHNRFNRGLEGGADFAYVNQWHLPVYWATYHLPDFEHRVGAYGLQTIYGKNATRDVMSITYMHDLNVPRDSYVMDKLDSLGAWWSRVFSFDWLDRQVDSLYGHHRPVTWAPGVYRYDRNTDTFVRISVPDLTVTWRAPRSRRSRIEPQDVEEGVIFEVDGVLYVYACSWGRLVYTLERNADTYPYFAERRYRLHFGRQTPEGLELRVHSESSGRYLYTATSGPTGEGLVLKEEFELDNYDRARLADQFKHFARWLERASNQGGSADEN